MKVYWKQTLYKALAVFLTISMSLGAVLVASLQTTVSPENPLIEPLVKQLTPLSLTPTVEVDDELLDEEAPISEALIEETGDTNEPGTALIPEGVRSSIGLPAGLASAQRDGDQFFNVVIDESPTPPKWLEFYLIHYHPASEYTPQNIAVSLNGSLYQDYSPDAELGVQLSEAYAINIVAVRVTYTLPDGSQYTPAPVIRRIPILTKALRFYPDPPEPEEVYNSTYSFALTAYYLDPITGERIEVVPRVFCGGTEFFRDGSGLYHINLGRGQNTVTMTAEAKDAKSIDAQTMLTYSPPPFEINIDPYEFPSLVHDPAYSFRVWLTEPDSNVRIQVFHKNKEIKPSGDTYYLTFDLGHNKIDIAVSRSYGGEMQTVYQRTEWVEYRLDVDGRGETKPPGVFYVNTNLPEQQPDGYIHIDNTTFFLRMEVFDYAFQRVYDSNIEVYCNDELRYLRQEWYGVFEYELPLKQGHNELKIDLRDDSQKTKVISLQIWCDPTHGTVIIGRATIVVDASEIGLGVIATGTVAIVQGESAAYQVQNLLQQNGFSSNFGGSEISGFYLAHILGTGITNGYSLPESAIEEYIQQGIWNGECYEDSLGEKNFTNTSGWLVSVGNAEPSMGLSSLYLKNGDVLRVTFRLT